MLNVRKASFIITMLVMSAASWAEDVREEKTLSLALANVAAAAAVEACQAKGWLVSATVVDRAGQIKAIQRADGAGPHTIDSSRRKAYTAASLRVNSSDLVQILQKILPPRALLRLTVC